MGFFFRKWTSSVQVLKPLVKRCFGKTRRPWQMLSSSHCGSENGRVVLEKKNCRQNGSVFSEQMGSGEEQSSLRNMT